MVQKWYKNGIKMGLGIEVQNLYVKVYYTESKIRKRYSTGVKLTNRDQIGENGHLDHPKTEYVDQLFSFV
jgi:hypothetical protein